MLKGGRHWLGPLVIAAMLGASPALRAQELDPSKYPGKIRSIIENSVVRIGSVEGSGTGFLVSPQGHILTAWHVLNGVSGGGDSSRIAYVRSVYQVEFAGRRRCPVWADLVGASDYRDVAVLQVRPSDWDSRSLEDSCLEGVAPVVIDWQLDPETKISRSTYPYGAETHYAIGYPATCAEANGTGAACALRGFKAFQTAIRRPEDEWGLIELAESVEKGFSGGPVVLEDGRVVGMIILRDYEDQNPVTRFVPSPLLERPLWTFGVAVDKEHSVLEDHYKSVLDYISRRDEIVDALEAFDEMYEFLSIPEVIEDEAEFRRSETDRGPLTFPYFAFERRWANAPNPARFEVTHACVPKDEKLQSLFVGDFATGLLEEERREDGASYVMVPPSPPPPESVVEAAAGEVSALSLGVRYEIWPTSRFDPTGVDLLELLRACGSMHRGVIREMVDKLEQDPGFFTIQTRDEGRQETPQAQILREFAANGRPAIEEEEAYSAIVFFIAAVYRESGV